MNPQEQTVVTERVDIVAPAAEPTRDASALGSEDYEIIDDVPFNEVSENENFIDMIKRDHEEVKNLYQKYKSAVNEEERARLSNTIIHLISRHSVAEELEIYPLVVVYDKHMTDGRAVSAKNREEHQEVKTVLNQVDKLKPTDPRFDPLLEKAIESFQAHSLHEERNELPMLLRSLGEKEAINVGRRFAKARRSGPTHPHPNAPNKGGFMERAAATLSKPFDKMRDMSAREKEV
ncbi:hypothetical protein HDV05_007482 [Chytridiales sp. JEL 0842]|nr:hypothetical protein HDV05_007482 [Chytridiales sp. JEL 0842]